MRKYVLLCFICLSCYGKLLAQNHSPYVYPMPNTSEWDAIQLFNDTVYFSIMTDNLDELFTNRIVKVNHDLSVGKAVQKLSVSIYGHLEMCNDYLVGYSRLEDYRNYMNGQLTFFAKDGSMKGPVIVGDSANEIDDITAVDGTVVLAGLYQPRSIEYGMAGFLARYGMDGQKIWEKYLCFNPQGFKTTFFDYVFYTRNQEIMVIGRSRRDSFGLVENRVISLLLDTGGNLLSFNSELDSLGWQYDPTFSKYRLPRLDYLSGIQVNDSTYAALLYSNTNKKNWFEFPNRWVFFNDKGHVLGHRKAWMYRDTLNQTMLLDQSFKNLVKRKDGEGFLAEHFFIDSSDAIRMIGLDQELYVTKIFPGISNYEQPNSFAALQAFVEDDRHQFYQLRSLYVDSISTTDYYGSLVCKTDSNGTLLSNGPLFPTGMGAHAESVSARIYPNPVRQWLNLEPAITGEYTFMLRSLDGRLLREGTFTAKYAIDMGTFPAGIYILTLCNDTGASQTMKVIRE